MRRVDCEHRRKRVVPGRERGKPSVEWCRDCGAARFGFLNANARWVFPGVRASSKPSKPAPASRQLRIVGVDDVPCPECPGASCGFCEGSGMVSASLARDLRFAKEGNPNG